MRKHIGEDVAVEVEDVVEEEELELFTRLILDMVSIAEWHTH